MKEFSELGLPKPLAKKIPELELTKQISNLGLPKPLYL